MDPMSYRTRKRLCMLVLVVGLPGWIVLSATVVGLLDRPAFLVELAVYVGLGILWALPFRALFRGMGRAAPGAEEPRSQ